MYVVYFSALRGNIFFQKRSVEREKLLCLYSLYSTREVCVTYDDHTCEQSVVMMCLGHVL